MSIPIVAQRRAARARMIERARAYAEDLAVRLPGVRAAVVVGSVARGDWNKWSDIDVLVVADTLPDDPRARLEFAIDASHPGVQAVLWTPAELAERRRRNDPIAREADSVGEIVLGALPRSGRTPGLWKGRVWIAPDETP